MIYMNEFLIRSIYKVSWIDFKYQDKNIKSYTDTYVRHKKFNFPLNVKWNKYVEWDDSIKSRRENMNLFLETNFHFSLWWKKFILGSFVFQYKRQKWM